MFNFKLISEYLRPLQDTICTQLMFSTSFSAKSFIFCFANFDHIQFLQEASGNKMWKFILYRRNMRNYSSQCQLLTFIRKDPGRTYCSSKAQFIRFIAMRENNTTLTEPQLCSRKRKASRKYLMGFMTQVERFWVNLVRRKNWDQTKFIT